MNSIFVDTNILLRYITGAPKDQAERTFEFIAETTKQRSHKLIIADSVISETVFTLRSYYDLSKKDTEAKVAPFFGFVDVISPSKKFDWYDVFRMEQEKNVDYNDALHYLLMRQAEIDTILSFDTDFDRFEDIKRNEP